VEYSREALDRKVKIQAMKEAGIICYANHFHGKQDIIDIRKEESQVKDAKELMDNGSVGEFKTAGRIISSRGM
jgi:lysyl-tRNA synthetase class II